MKIKDNNKSAMIILYSDTDVSLLGEPVRIKMQIINNNSETISISGFRFDWEELTFFPPNSVHLLDPDKKELALPYECAPSDYEAISFIKVPAQGEEWFYLPLYRYFNFRKPGQYEFSLQLQDNKEKTFKSNIVYFTLKEDVTLLAPDKIDLKIEIQNKKVKTSEKIIITAVWTNQSTRTYTFLKPQDDSYNGWVNPVYQFIVKDSARRILPIALRSGSMATPRYDHSTMFSLKPESSFEQSLLFPIFPKMRQPGNYNIQLIYLVRKKQIGKGGKVLERDMAWDKDVFIGRIESNIITVQIEE